jgi:hypothetical protein
VSPHPRRVAPGGGTEAALLDAGRDAGLDAGRRTRGARARPQPSTHTILAILSMRLARVTQPCRARSRVSLLSQK